jgi:hypothetical protein
VLLAPVQMPVREQVQGQGQGQGQAQAQGQVQVQVQVQVQGWLRRLAPRRQAK